MVHVIESEEQRFAETLDAGLARFESAKQSARNGVIPGDEAFKLYDTFGFPIDLTEVLMIADGDNVTIGKPCIAGASVTAEVKSQGRGEKVKIIKFKRRKHYMRQAGHRQAYTELAITGIKTG